MKTLELEIVQGFFFYPHYAFRYIFVKLDFANSVAFFKAFEKATEYVSYFIVFQLFDNSNLRCEKVILHT